MVVANGQFLIIKRDAYLKSGGFDPIKSEVLDDLMIAKQLVKSGFNDIKKAFNIFLEFGIIFLIRVMVMNLVR